MSWRYLRLDMSPWSLIILRRCWRGGGERVQRRACRGEEEAGETGRAVRFNPSREAERDGGARVGANLRRHVLLGLLHEAKLALLSVALRRKLQPLALLLRQLARALRVVHRRVRSLTRRRRQPRAGRRHRHAGALHCCPAPSAALTGVSLEPSRCSSVRQLECASQRELGNDGLGGSYTDNVTENCPLTAQARPAPPRPVARSPGRISPDTRSRGGLSRGCH